MDCHEEHTEALEQVSGTPETKHDGPGSPVKPSGCGLMTPTKAVAASAPPLPPSTPPAEAAGQKGPLQERSVSGEPRAQKREPPSTWQEDGPPGPDKPVRLHGRGPSVAIRTLEQIGAEQQYLVSNLHGQEARTRALVSALATAQAELQAASTSAEARRIRKKMGFIRRKIADAEQQEHLALLGLGNVGAELQSHHRHVHLQQQLDRILTTSSLVPGQDAGAVGHSLAHGVREPPQTPYLIPYDAAAGTHWLIPSPFVVSPVTPGITAAMPTSPVSPSTRPPREYVSPMSPLAPVFEPRSSLFYLQTVPEADSRQGSPDETALGAAGAAEREEAASAPSAHGKSRPEERESEAGLAGMHYVYDAGSDDCGPDVLARKDARLRRGSHGAAEETQAKPKRMSLPPVRFSWPED